MPGMQQPVSHEIQHPSHVPAIRWCMYICTLACPYLVEGDPQAKPATRTNDKYTQPLQTLRGAAEQHTYTRCPHHAIVT